MCTIIKENIKKLDRVRSVSLKGTMLFVNNSLVGYSEDKETLKKLQNIFVKMRNHNLSHEDIFQ